VDILEFLYENPPTFKDVVARKSMILATNTHIFGPPLSGKTYLALDYLKNQEKKFLYLDLDDLRLQRKNIADLEGFIHDEKIEIFAIDNYKEGFSLPQNTLQNIVIANAQIDLAGYTPLQLFAFDFEEFLATTSKSAAQSFNLYLKNGALDTMLQQIVRARLDENSRYLFCYLCAQCAKTLSGNQIYLALKKEMKVSKDWLYKRIEEFSANGLIRFIGKFDAPNAQKKLFILHQPFINALTFNTGFIHLFHNLVVTESIKKGFFIEYESSGGYVVNHNKLVLIEPFASEEAVWVKIQKRFSEYKKNGFHSITCITVSSSFEFSIDILRIEAMPFYEWAVLDEF
jgi:hypothetical protein